MAFGIKLADATFTHYVSRAVPYLSDLEGFFIFGGNETSSIKNLSPSVGPGATGTMIGGGAAGTYGDDYAMLNITYTLDTGITTDGLDKSIISVSEFQADEHSSIATSGGSMQVSRIGGAFRARFPGGVAGGSGDDISLNVPTFQAVTMGDGTGNHTLWRGIAGTLDSNTAADASFAAENIEIGPKSGEDDVDGTGDTTFHKHYLALIYGRELTSGEMAELYAWSAEYMAARGVLVA
ncbi:hypothetical protein [uncultured Mameliella sp.]|uniref:hypothetical protein n=1 Tax=uncultured Mameliella sp. TaxID=1447087 RepID=UPI002622CD58|nr:hypothetical protein [uncultured Mameliella sp.]